MAPSFDSQRPQSLTLLPPRDGSDESTSTLTDADNARLEKANSAFDSDAAVLPLHQGYVELQVSGFAGNVTWLPHFLLLEAASLKFFGLSNPNKIPDLTSGLGKPEDPSPPANPPFMGNIILDARSVIRVETRNEHSCSFNVIVVDARASSGQVCVIRTLSRNGLLQSRPNRRRSYSQPPQDLTDTATFRSWYLALLSAIRVAQSLNSPLPADPSTPPLLNESVTPSSATEVPHQPLARPSESVTKSVNTPSPSLSLPRPTSMQPNAGVILSSPFPTVSRVPETPTRKSLDSAIPATSFKTTVSVEQINTSIPIQRSSNIMSNSLTLAQVRASLGASTGAVVVATPAASSKSNVLSSPAFASHPPIRDSVDRRASLDRRPSNSSDLTRRVSNDRRPYVPTTRRRPSIDSSAAPIRQAGLDPLRRSNSFQRHVPSSGTPTRGILKSTTSISSFASANATPPAVAASLLTDSEVGSTRSSMDSRPSYSSSRASSEVEPDSTSMAPVQNLVATGSSKSSGANEQSSVRKGRFGKQLMRLFSARARRQTDGSPNGRGDNTEVGRDEAEDDSDVFRAASVRSG
ncbi:hypothetical protein DFJ73DRAFT_849586 [Zopfochytrium polystomum]|nr:hypothetical protein DFJ73DRAFT_849586 [Zopfochytrium polystomum]